MSVIHTYGCDPNIETLEKYVKKDILEDGSHMNKSAMEYVKDFINPMKLSDIFNNAYNRGACTINRVIVILILLHMRIEAFSSYGPIVFNLAYNIWVSMRRKIKDCMCEASQGSDRIRNKYKLNYLKNSPVKVNSSGEIIITDEFSRIVNTLTEREFIDITNCMFCGGNCSHDTMIRILMMLHVMMKRGDVNKWQVVSSLAHMLSMKH